MCPAHYKIIEITQDYVNNTRIQSETTEYSLGNQAVIVNLGAFLGLFTQIPFFVCLFVLSSKVAGIADKGSQIPVQHGVAGN